MMSSKQDSELILLRRQIEEEKRQRQEAEERAEQLRQRAEDEQRQRENADKRAEDEQRRRQEAEAREEEAKETAERELSKTRPTTFKEYVQYCHEHLSKPCRVQQHKSLTTQGPITSSSGKPCPVTLERWTEFPELQEALFQKVYEYFPEDKRLFGSFQGLLDLGKLICDRPLASEKDLEVYQRLAVESPTTQIISHLRQIAEAHREFDLGDGIMFENHPNTLSDASEEVREALQNLAVSSRGRKSNQNPKPRYADQICVYKHKDGTKSLCMVVEYKPAHKLGFMNLLATFEQAEDGSVNVSEVISRATTPTDLKEKYIHNSEQLTVAALTQTYSYMLENGLEYSKLATGDADVFLRIKEDDPFTLYYHLADFTHEESSPETDDTSLCHSAVSQTLAFSLMALKSKLRSQKWRDNALKDAPIATIDIEEILRQIPEEEKKLSPPLSVYRAHRKFISTRSTVKLRPRKPNAKSSCGSVNIIVHEDRQSASSFADEASDIETTNTPSKSMGQTRQSGARQGRSINSSQAAKESEVHHQQYCTQACLLGLIRHGPVDDTCPNINAHRTHGASSHHALSRESLAELMLSQLTQDMDNNCEPLGKQGACGALFKLTLASHRYTIVAKGTVEAFEAKLKYEGSVYRHLDQVQGKLIPVYLGNISLVRPYFLDFGVKIVHWLLMSWAGEQARKDLMLGMGRDLAAETSRSVKKLLDCRVEHRDVRPPNVLWNPEIRSVVLIDFERSAILKQVPVLQEITSNRKRMILHRHKGMSCDEASDMEFVGAAY